MFLTDMNFAAVNKVCDEYLPKEPKPVCLLCQEEEIVRIEWLTITILELCGCLSAADGSRCRNRVYHCQEPKGEVVKGEGFEDVELGFGSDEM